MKTMRVRLTLTEEMLGTASNNPEIHSEFIASKAPDAKSREEEIESILTNFQTRSASVYIKKTRCNTPQFMTEARFGWNRPRNVGKMQKIF